MNGSNDSQHKWQQKIEEALKKNHIDRESLKQKPMEELLQEVSIYHQELEYQNLELMRIQQELEASRAHYMSLFRDAPVAIAIMDEKHQVQAVNEEFCAVTGRSPDEINGTHIEEWIAPESQDLVYHHFRSLVREGEAAAAQIKLDAVGGIKTVKLQSNIMEEGGKRQIRTSLVDMTPEKEMEEALKEKSRDLETARRKAESANDAKTQFMSNISHELRTPMNGVYGFLQLLLNTEVDEEQLEYIDHMMHSSRRMLRLINHLLDFSNLESGETQLVMQEIVLQDLITSLACTWENEAKEKKLEFLFELSPELPQYILGDAERLGKIVENLLDNAVKFTNEGTIRLKVEPLKEEEPIIWLSFVVEDTGIGVGQEDLNRIFEWFNQADNSNTRKYGGIGIGLTMAHQLTSRMGGHLEVASTYGEGSRFQVNLPFGRVSEEELQQFV